MDVKQARAAEKLLQSILASEPPATLYHYTTQQGLLGILEKGEIWATHTQYLNDPREFTHARDLVEEVIGRERKAATDPNEQSHLELMALEQESLENVNVCVCSFSALGDDLAQWRAYSGGGPGFAIGFTKEALREITTGGQFTLAKCIYSQRRQRQIAEALVQKHLAEGSMATRVPPGGRNEDDDLPIRFANSVMRYAPILKDSAFRGEKEWRLISRALRCTSERFAYRPGRSTIVPYYRIPLGGKDVSASIDRIVIGPTPHPQLSKSAVMSLLVSKIKARSVVDTLASINIENSKVPYRNW